MKQFIMEWKMICCIQKADIEHLTLTLLYQILRILKGTIYSSLVTCFPPCSCRSLGTKAASDAGTLWSRTRYCHSVCGPMGCGEPLGGGAQQKEVRPQQTWPRRGLWTSSSCPSILLPSCHVLNRPPLSLSCIPSTMHCTLIGPKATGTNNYELRALKP